VVIATGSDASLPEGLTSQVVYERTSDDLPLLAARLRHEHGVRSVVCEGGPTLNFHLLSASLVDELWLTLNPKLAGGAAALTIVAGRGLVDPVDLEPVSVAEGDGDLFTRWRIR
jgi:riboflavin biosynthesis pyrimidine reductase